MPVMFFKNKLMIMKVKWFKRTGWMHIPIHIMGGMTTLLAQAFVVPVFTATIRDGHSVSDNLYPMFVYTTCIAFWWKWVAERSGT